MLFSGLQRNADSTSTSAGHRELFSPQIHLLVSPNPLPKGLTHRAPWQRPPRPASLLPLLPCKAPLSGCHTLMTFQRPVSILECSEPQQLRGYT